MWIDPRGRQHRVYWRTGLASPKRASQPFDTREKAEAFRELARLVGLTTALQFLAEPNETPRAGLSHQPRPRRAQPCRRSQWSRRSPRQGVWSAAEDKG